MILRYHLSLYTLSSPISVDVRQWIQTADCTPPFYSKGLEYFGEKRNSQEL